LPEDISLLVTFETSQRYKVENITECCCDYSIAFEGPGDYFVSEAKAAKRRNIRLYTMSNTGGMTWDLGVIPYMPTPHQWIKRYKNMRKANAEWGLCGLMESHHYGFIPNFIAEIAKCVYTRETDENAVYDKLEEIARQIIEENQCFSLKDLAVNGKDMITLGLKGKYIGLALDELLKAVIEERCSNDKESLLSYYHRNVKSV
jgi:hypothetical protein